ncbi:hypothetical protein M5689_005895 [Euphorbia peplus]|nr:hypothetical protein M5689_005895 [Euphorbia peplus]
MASQVKDLNLEVAINAVSISTTSENIKLKLMRKQPQTFEELMAIAHSHVRLDDIHRATNYEESEIDKTGKTTQRKTSRNHFQYKDNLSFAGKKHISHTCLE